MILEHDLIDKCGNSDANFVVLEDGSGITLRDFKYDGKTYTIIQRSKYKPWGFGKENIGAGQIGIYLLRYQGQLYYAVIRDYREHEGAWRIILMCLSTDAAEVYRVFYSN